MIWKFYIEDISEVQTEVPNPVGWADATFKFRRDRDLHGVFFDYSVPLKFHGTGYDIIKSAYDSNGVEAFLRVIITVQCFPSDDFEEFYAAKLNFSKIQFLESDVCFVEMVLEDDSCLSMFNSRIDQEVDLASLESFDGVALDEYENLGKVIPLAPKVILKTDRFGYEDEGTIDGEQVTAEDSSTSVGVQTFTEYIWLNPPDIINEISGVADDYEKGYSSVLTNVPTYWIVPYLPGSANWLLEIEMQFRLEVDVLLTNGEVNGCGVGDRFEDVTATLVLRRLRGVTLSYQSLATVTFTGCHDNLFDEEIDFSFSGAFPGPMADVQSSDEFAIYIQVETSGDFQKLNPSDPIAIDLFNVVTQHGTSFFKVTVETVYPTTSAKINMVNEALSRCAESITNNCLRVFSNYFGRTVESPSAPYAPDPGLGNGCGSLECITTGLMIRRKEDATQKISFKKLFDGLNAIHNLGIGIEDDPNRSGYKLIRIERTPYFYNDTFIMNIDKVPEIKITALTEEHFSVYEFGYPKWEAEAYNGLDEFNTTRKYRTSLKTVKNTLSKISSLIASGYAIEVTRQQFINTSKDWRYDNDDFIICVVSSGDGFIVEQGSIEGYEIIDAANMIDPDSVYNFRISPNRNALRHLQKVLASYVDPAITGSLYFMSGTGNTSAEGLLNDGCIYEDGVLSEQEPEINVATLSDENNGLPIYVLQLWEFEYPLTFAEYQAIRANPNGIISVRYGQQEDFHDCYIREIEYRPNQGLANFQLLPSYPFTTTRFILQQSGFYILQQSGGKIIWR